MSGHDDVAFGVVESVFGTLCVLNEVGTGEKSNSVTNKIQDIKRVSLSMDTDNQLSGLKTLPSLRRPEFFHGKMNSTTASQVKRAVAASMQCRDVCSEWAQHAMASGKASQINDKILKWCQNEFFRADSADSNVKQVGLKCDTVNGNRVSRQVDAAENESSGNPSLREILQKMLCCCFKPADAKKEKGSEAQGVQIFVKRLNGTIFSVNIDAGKPKVDGKESPGPGMILTDTVGMLKMKICREKGISPDLQFLIFENNYLEHDKPLHVCGVLPHSTIHLIQVRSVLGVEEAVSVEATEERGIVFNSEKFHGLYRWYRDGQPRPDVYMGEFLNGILRAVRHSRLSLNNFVRRAISGSRGGILSRWRILQVPLHHSSGSFIVPNSSVRGEWADDQQHGFGVQRWRSGAVYCGHWDRNKENGWGAFFSPCHSPSEHNPHSAQMLFLGRFHNGCPTDGMVIECSDFRQLNAESFASEQCEATAKDISTQKFRVYDVFYDGVTAFWQSPIPKQKRGLFDLKIKLCEYEVLKVDRPLAHKRSLEEIWYKWIPNPNMEKKDNVKNSLGGDEEQDAKEDKPVPPMAPLAPKPATFETFYYHGTCVRDKGGNFPCPTDGVLSFETTTRGLQKNLKIDHLVEYKAKFNSYSNNNPALQCIEGKAKYAIPNNALKKEGESLSKDGKDIKSLLIEFLSVFLLESTDHERLAGLITHVEFEGELHSINFPLHGMMLIKGEIMKVEFDGETSIQRFVSHKSFGKADGSKEAQTSSGADEEAAEKSNEDQDDGDDNETEIDDGSSWGEMERYGICFGDWMRQKQESKLIVKLPKPSTEPPARKDQIPVLRDPSDALKEASKMQAHQVWHHSGVLARRSQEFPLEPSVMETVYSGTGMIFEGWSKKVYCPKSGFLKLLIEDNPKSKGHATDEDKDSLSSCIFDIDVDLKECSLLPGSEDWFKYALTRLKMRYIQKLRIEHAKLKEELVQLKCIDFKKAKDNLLIRKQELTAAVESSDQPKIQEDSSKNDHILHFFSLIPESFMGKNSTQTKLASEIRDSKKKAVDAAKKKLSNISFSVIEKELEAAEKNELCTGIAVIEHSSRFLQTKNSVVHHRYLLKKDVDNIKNMIDATNAELDKLSKISLKLNAGIKQNVPGQAETSAQTKAKKARLAVELARLDPSISKIRMSIVRRTIRLLTGIEEFEKAAKVQQELMIAKAEARLNSNAALRRQKLLIRAIAKDCLTNMNLETDDSEMLSVLREPTREDLLKQINDAATDSSRETELLHLQTELQILEEKKFKEEIRSTDLNAEIQIASARLGAEEAERNLWAEWAQTAMMEETDKPHQGPSTCIGLKLAALDEANKRLTQALREAQRDADFQSRKSTPASEMHPKAELCKTAWVPVVAVSPENLAKAVSKLVAQAQRVMHRAAQCLQGPASTLVLPPLKDSARMCKEITDAKKELQSLA